MKTASEPTMPPRKQSSTPDPRQLWWAAVLAVILVGIFLIGYINRSLHDNGTLSSNSTENFAKSNSHLDSAINDEKKNAMVDPLKSFETAMQPVEKGLYAYRGESFDGQNNNLEMSLRLKGRIEFDSTTRVKYDVEKTRFLGSTHIGKIVFQIKMKASAEGIVDNRKFRIPFESYYGGAKDPHQPEA
jgi:hypothetical protein